MNKCKSGPFNKASLFGRILIMENKENAGLKNACKKRSKKIDMHKFALTL